MTWRQNSFGAMCAAETNCRLAYLTTRQLVLVLRLLGNRIQGLSDSRGSLLILDYPTHPTSDDKDMGNTLLRKVLGRYLTACRRLTPEVKLCLEEKMKRIY